MAYMRTYIVVDWFYWLMFIDPKSLIPLWYPSRVPYIDFLYGSQNRFEPYIECLSLTERQSGDGPGVPYRMRTTFLLLYTCIHQQSYVICHLHQEWLLENCWHYDESPHTTYSLSLTLYQNFVHEWIFIN